MIEMAMVCLALTIYHEARGEPTKGQLAVGRVVQNRVTDPRWPGNVCDVVRQGGEWPRFKCQFSWWCDGKSDKPYDKQTWSNAMKISQYIIDNPDSDVTKGAKCYHGKDILPVWATGPVTLEVGGHVFREC